MSFNHVVVWMDHAEAHVIHFNPEAAESEVIKTHSKHPHLHTKSGVAGSGHAAESAQYFDAVADAVKGSLEILIVGPGSEKSAFLKHLSRHQADLADKVLSVETVDHPSDGQLLAYARKYFLRADRMR
ncbi:MAG TPA: translational machinery protein [Janthinobacterium sp.]|nr:translational machinery protein [Janthinobacterium sp.]